MRRSHFSVFRAFLSSEALSGIVLILVAIAALWVANSASAPFYFAILEIHAGGLSVLHWINDAFMAIFFLLVGLEIKRELVGGQLASWSHRILPGLGAIGGIVVPAAIFLALNAYSPIALRGWAIPSATDIAFSLGIVALLGSKVPVSLKIFLTALAILDDLGAVVIITAFYTSNLVVMWLILAGCITAILVGLNRFKVQNLAVYLSFGVFLWICVLKSGVHPTLAGVALAATIPIGNQEKQNSPLHRLEHRIQPWVAFLIVPMFGFANAGVSLSGLNRDALLKPVTLGAAAGLFLGKQFGIFSTVYLAVKFELAERPRDASWAQVYAVSILAGIGFTMSLFIGLLAFPTQTDLQNEVKIGVLLGSTLSAFTGAAFLYFAPGQHKNRA